MQKKYKHIYGPVYSWRLGMSLGIDPISTKEKVCNFDCIYCQLGRTKTAKSVRQVFVSTEEIVSEVQDISSENIDYYTFSGRGEPTLAKNLGEMICAVKKVKKAKVAVITNAALMGRQDVQDDLMGSDCVVAKLDACCEDVLKEINVSESSVKYNAVVDGIKSFKAKFTGRFALQIMFVQENKKYAQALSDVARDIAPDEIQINTPLRPSGAAPVSEEEMMIIKGYFKDLPVRTVYEAERYETQPFDEQETIRRHGNFKESS